MNWDTITGQWKQVKGKVKEKWGNSPTMNSTKSAARRISSSVNCKKSMATPRIRQNGKQTSFVAPAEAVNHLLWMSSPN